MRGDTIEYNTGNIVLQHNSTVEDLLRHLPGLQIDINGNITYNGQKIDHLLVDGEDIFGSDPTLVTRTFDASKIARVQILNRKNEQSLFTGIDDGSRTKTLNLVMKESAKNGYFGKGELGGNFSGDYNSNAALAAFKKARQFTALGASSNAGILGFSTTEGGSSTTVSFLNTNADPLGASAGKGIPIFSALALHYAGTGQSQADHLSVNYQYSHYVTEPIAITQSLQTEPDSVYAQSQHSQSRNLQDQHWAYGAYDWTLRPRSTLKLIFHGNTSLGSNQFNAINSSAFNDTLINNSWRTIQDHASRQNVGGTLNWRMLVGGRADRVLSAIVGVTKVDNTTDGYLYSVNSYYLPNGNLESRDTIDERKLIITHEVTNSGTINFTEPLWQRSILGISVGASQANDAPLQGSYARGNGKYTDIIDSLSSHFRTATSNDHVTINIQGRNKHLSYTIETNWLNYHYHQLDVIKGSSLFFHYSTWSPKATLIFTPGSTTYIRFHYESQTKEATASQLAPIINNSDPLHISLGNPNLKPSVLNSFIIEFHNFKTWILNAEATFTTTQNDISTKTNTDNLGRQINQPVNVNGGRALSINLDLNRRIAGIDAGVSANGNYSRAVNYVNDELNTNKVFNFSTGVAINKYVAGKYSAEINSTINYFDQFSSVNLGVPIRYWTHIHQGSFTLFLIRNFTINTNGSYSWQSKTAGFGNETSTFLLNVSISRSFLNNWLTGKIQLNNILNEALGISRTNDININTQSFTNILGRYWMMSIIYNFDRKFRQ